MTDPPADSQVPPKKNRETTRDRRIVAWIVGSVFLLLAILTYQPSRAATDGLLAGVAWRYLEGVLLLVLIFSLFTLGLNLEFGYTGLINFGHVAFLSIGAYAAAVAADRVGSRLYEATAIEAAGWMLLILAGSSLVSVAFALLLGGPTLRLREDYLAIVTIGAAEILRLVWLNQEAWTNGPQGLSVRIPGASWILDRQTGWGKGFTALRDGPLRIDLDPYMTFMILATLVILAAVYILQERLVLSPWGRVLKAIREDADVAAALGKNVFLYKMQSLIIGSLIASTAGILFAWYQRFITPDTFLPILTFYAWIALVAGGVGNNKGAFAGSVLLWGIFEAARQLPAIQAIGLVETAGPPQVAAIGILLILIMMFRPHGAVGRRKEMMYAK